MSNLDLSRIAQAQRVYDRMEPEENEGEGFSFSSRGVRTPPSDELVDQFIAEFAERGFYLDEFGNKKTEPLYCAVAKQYSRSSVGYEIGPVLFRWAKACVSLGCWF